MLSKMKKYFRQLSRIKIGSSNFRKTRHLIVVFDSDDWGVLRCVSPAQKAKIIQDGYQMDNEAFCSHDCLETEEDITLLAGLLSSFKDHQGNHPIFTLNFSMNNPDYPSIIHSNFTKFYSIPFVNYYGDNKTGIFALFRQFEHSTLEYEFHGAQHIDVPRFLNDGAKSIGFCRIAAGHNLTCIGNSYSDKNHFGYMDELNTGKNEDNERFILENLTEAKNQFEAIFSKKANFLTPSCGVLPKEILRHLSNAGFKYVKISEHFYDVDRAFGCHRKLIIKKKRYGVNFVVRNCDFEPTISSGAYENAVYNIDLCAKLKKPCIICTHRLNYVSSMGKEYRERGLSELKRLLSYIVTKYPDAEFMSTEECVNRYLF
jgi:hypothetical protein